MGELSLSELLGKGIGDGDGPPPCPDEPDLAGRSRRDLVRLIRDRSVSYEQKDRVFAAAIRCYRRHPTQQSSELLLALLAPALIRRLRAVETYVVGIERADLRQQVVIETLKAASSMPIPQRFVQRRVEDRVFTYIHRWIGKMTRHRRDDTYYDDDHEDVGATAEMEGVLERLDLQQLGIATQDLRLAYRCQVGGETASKLALEYGVTPRLIRARLHRVLRQLRNARPELLDKLADLRGTAA